MDEIKDKVSEKLGPLAVWQWGILAAVAYVVYRRISSNQGNGVQTVTLQPQNSGGIATTGPNLGSVGNFLGGLSEQYPNLSFTLPDGTTFNLNDGVFVPKDPAPNNPAPTPVQPPSGTNPVQNPVINPLPTARPGYPIVGVTPNPLPINRPGGGGSVVPPNAFPYGSPIVNPPQPIIPVIRWPNAPVAPLPKTQPTPTIGVNPISLPPRR